MISGRAGLLVLALMLLAGCQTDGSGQSLLAEAPRVAPMTKIGERLRDAPPPVRAVDIAVYAFPDLTGQYKESDTSTEYSRAVTQGANAFLIDALQQAGNGEWFNVVERSGLQNLLQERQIISTTRQQYTPSAPGLPPLRFAGIIVEGGVVGYDTNTTTGGAGARFLGVGGDAEYRRDTITVALRAVSVRSGELLSSITTTKTLYSIALRGGAFRYIALNELLEAEAGVTRNEPTTMAVREVIDLAVAALIVDGAGRDLWAFKDGEAGARFSEAFLKRSAARSKLLSPSPSESAGSARPPAPVAGGVTRDASTAAVEGAPPATIAATRSTDSTNEASTRELPVTVTPATRFGPNMPPPS